jgi:hypothetical protein
MHLGVGGVWICVVDVLIAGKVHSQLQSSSFAPAVRSVLKGIWGNLVQEHLAAMTSADAQIMEGVDAAIQEGMEIPEVVDELAAEASSDAAGKVGDLDRQI